MWEAQVSVWFTTSAPASAGDVEVVVIVTITMGSKESEEGEKFWVAPRNNRKKRFPRDQIEHVLEIHKERRTRRCHASRLRHLDISVYCQLHGFNNEVHTAAHSHRKVVGKEVPSKAVAKGDSNM